MPDKKGKNPGGRPTKYDPKYNTQAYKHCLLGAKDTDLADFFEVDVSTINNWKNDYPKFLDSIKKGRHDADHTVVKSLYKKANGYKQKRIETKVLADGTIKKIVHTDYFPPDTTAQIFWLKNRQRTYWRDKHDVDHTTAGKPINVGVIDYGKQPE